MPAAKKKQQSEQEIQIAVAAYLDTLGVLWCHVTNEGLRSQRTGRILQLMGMKRGVPDIFIFEPNGENALLAIELKREKGGVVSEHQRKWISDLNAPHRKYKAVVCRGELAALNAINDYLSKGGFKWPNTECSQERS